VIKYAEIKTSAGWRCGSVLQHKALVQVPEPLSGPNILYECVAAAGSFPSQQKSLLHGLLVSGNDSNHGNTMRE
jgi:hypothetical protein